MSFAELGRRIPGFSATENDTILICIDNDVFWAVTSFGSEVFEQIKSRVAFHPSSLLLYLINGASLNLRSLGGSRQ